MFRRIVDIKTFDLEKIIERLNIFIFSQICTVCAREAFLRRKSNFLKLKNIKI